MKKLIISFCLIGSALVILQSPDVLNSIVLFLMAGIIPGTNTPISATGMLIIFSIFSLALIGWFIVTHAVSYLSIDHIARTQYTVTKRGTVRRRYKLTI